MWMSQFFFSRTAAAAAGLGGMTVVHKPYSTHTVTERERERELRPLRRVNALATRQLLSVGKGRHHRTALAAEAVHCSWRGLVTVVT